MDFQRSFKKKVAVLEDLSVVGNISSKVATAALGTFGFNVLPVPTVLLSAQSEGFGTPHALLTDDWFSNALHDVLQSGELTAMLIGYVGNASTLDIISDQLTKHPQKQLLLDPVFGDEQKLYPTLTSDYVEKLKGLLKFATIITPNVTEFCMLAGLPAKKTLTSDELLSGCEKIRQLGNPDLEVVVTGVPQDEGLATCWVHGETLMTFVQRYAPGHFDGAGDMFASILLACLMDGLEIELAVERAAQVSVQTLQRQSEVQYDHHLGINTGIMIDAIIKVTREN